MNLGTLIIGIICTIILALPFILTSRSKKKKGIELLTSLKDLAKQNNSEITKHEINSYYSIGLDETKQAVSFIFKSDEIFTSNFIDLTNVKSCKIENINILSRTNNQVLDKLTLNLSYFDKKKSDVVLTFFNSDVSYQPINEFESIEKWNKLICNILNNSTFNKAA